jgi:diguanylate cyclase (GGDEF)-like protein
MLADLKILSSTCRTYLILPALCVASTLAFGQVQPRFDERLIAMREVVRFVPERALGELLAMEAEGRAAPPPSKAEFLSQLGLARFGVGQQEAALVLADELIAFGRAHEDKVAIVHGLLNKANVKFELLQLNVAHELVWEAEKLANTTANAALRVRTAIASSASFSEDGNFPLALARLQTALALARDHGDPATQVEAYSALAQHYNRTREYKKGFQALGEASLAAEKINSPGLKAGLRNLEYGLALDSNQPRRAISALLAALALERRIGAARMIAFSLVGLSECYLKEHDYARALSYAKQTIAAARRLNDEELIASAQVNTGAAYLGMGRLAEGKRSFEAGLSWYEHSGAKPQLQQVLAEYGSVLEKAGDLAGALAAYHRERALSNELFEERRQKALLELQEKYEAEKKQRQIELLRRENQLKSADIEHRRLQQRIWWLLALVGAIAAAVVGFLYRKVRHANALLEGKNLELKQQSSRDPLTSLYNRRHFQEYMRNHRQTEKRGTGAGSEEMVAALFLLDVDHFKQVNDTYGHAAGDAVLKMLSDALHEILRETDMIVRWGGEEFLAFVPAVPRSGLDEVARRLLTGISSLTIGHQGIELTVNVSMGYAPFPLAPGGVALPWERVVNLIDQALYLAKANGRNRAYGIRSFPNFGQTSVEDIEQDLERAWRAGFVDLSIMPGGWPELRAIA